VKLVTWRVMRYSYATHTSRQLGVVRVHPNVPPEVIAVRQYGRDIFLWMVA
jgi:hypothetical protein